jgi:hypothetical protein
MARRFLTLLFAFAAMVLGIEGIRRVVDWTNGITPTPLDFVLIGCLPLLAWLWWRYLSPFGKGRGQCLDGACRREEGDL